MSVVQQMRGGRDYDADFATRMRGSGQFATLIERRFAIAAKRLGLNRERMPLDRSRFRAPVAEAAAPPRAATSGRRPFWLTTS
jgi:hypothetical protein